MTSEAKDSLGAYRAAVLTEVRRQLDLVPTSHHELLAYHLASAESGHKQRATTGLAPVLCLLVAEALGGDWSRVTPVAAAIQWLDVAASLQAEIFEGRRELEGRATVEAVWGMPLALNCQDAAYSVALLALSRLEGVSEEARVELLRRFDAGAARLWEGLYLELEFARREGAPHAERLRMMRDRGGSLAAMGASLGALFAGADEAAIDLLARFGEELGVACLARSRYSAASAPDSEEAHLQAALSLARGSGLAESARERLAEAVTALGSGV